MLEQKNNNTAGQINYIGNHTTPGPAGQPAEEPFFSSLKEKDLISSIGVKKFTKIFLSLYNKLCGPCRGMVNRNPKVSLEKYCQKCQPMLAEEMKRLMKK